MEPFDLVRSLKSLGVDEKSAEMLKAKLRGDDLMGLVNALNGDDVAAGVQKAKAILGKYDVQLGGSNQVDEYRKAEFEALKNGDLFAVENFINEWLEPVTGAKLGEGFDYAVELSEDSMDKVLDWLDENKIEYLAQTPKIFHIKCEDRAAAYKVSRGLSRIMGRPVVSDAQVEEDEIMDERKADKRLRTAKDKLANMKDRNPVVQGMIGKTGAGAHKGDPRKDDPHGRKAKYKANFEEGFDLEGELDGDLPMNEENDEKRLEEGVIGMNGLEPIFRLKELAGIKAAKKVEETDLVELGDDTDHVGDMAADAAMDDIGHADVGDVELGPDMAADAAMDASMGDDMGMDMGMDAPAVDPMADPMSDPMADDGMGALDAPAGMPGDLPPMPAEPALGMAMPTQSDAMMAIEDGLNSIQMKLSDIRLSEYKTLVVKLQDLATQVQNMGRDYLGERRKK